MTPRPPSPLGKWVWCASGAAGAFPFDVARNTFMRWVYEPGFTGGRWTHWYPLDGMTASTTLVARLR